MTTARTVTVALDLEGTLISNAVSVFARPGLHAFLDTLGGLADIAVYTSVSPTRGRQVVELLADEGAAPRWFAQVPVLTADRHTKNLDAIGGPCLLVDDRPDVVPDDQRDQLIVIDPFEPPYEDTDTALADLLPHIRRRLGS